MLRDSEKEWPVREGRNGLSDKYWKGIRKIREKLNIESNKTTEEFEKNLAKTSKREKKK